jgi:hypothetical protein
VFINGPPWAKRLSASAARSSPFDYKRNDPDDLRSAGKRICRRRDRANDRAVYVTETIYREPIDRSAIPRFRPYKVVHARLVSGITPPRGFASRPAQIESNRIESNRIVSYRIESNDRSLSVHDASRIGENRAGRQINGMTRMIRLKYHITRRAARRPGDICRLQSGDPAGIFS